MKVDRLAHPPNPTPMTNTEMKTNMLKAYAMVKLRPIQVGGFWEHACNNTKKIKKSFSYSTCIREATSSVTHER